MIRSIGTGSNSPYSDFTTRAAAAEKLAMEIQRLATWREGNHRAQLRAKLGLQMQYSMVIVTPFSLSKEEIDRYQKILK